MAIFDGFTNFDDENTYYHRNRIPITIRPQSATSVSLTVEHEDINRPYTSLDGIDRKGWQLANMDLGFPVYDTDMHNPCIPYNPETPLATQHAIIPKSGTRITWTGQSKGVTLRVRGFGSLGDTIINAPTYVNVYKSDCLGSNTLVGGHLEIIGAFSGFVIFGTENDVISCDMDLRGCDDVAENAWQVSTATAQIAYFGDVERGAFFTKDMTPVIIEYGATAQDKADTRRTFYLDGQPTYADGVLSISMKDRSSMLAEYQKETKYHRYYARNFILRLYEEFVATITDALTVGSDTPTIDVETAPSTIGESSTYNVNVIKGGSGSNWVANMINFSWYVRNSAELLYPRHFMFIDAGRPRIQHNYRSRFSVDKEWLGDFKKVYKRQIAKIKSSEKGVWVQTLIEENTGQTLWSGTVKSGRIYNADYNGYGRITGQTRCTISEEYGDHAIITGTANNTATVTGAKADLQNVAKTASSGIAGETVKINPPILGICDFEFQGLIFPYYDFACGISDQEERVSFTYRGDPRWQPLDVLAIDGKRYVILDMDFRYDGGLICYVNAKEYRGEF